MKATAPMYLLMTALLLSARIATAESATMQELVSQAESVDEAVQIVSSRLSRQGFEIPLTVNHTAAAASVDLELRPTQVENADVQLRVNPIGYLIDRHDPRIRDFGMYLTGALASQFAAAGTNSDQ